MKTSHLVAAQLAALLLTALTPAFAQYSFSPIDYPNSGNTTSAFGINNTGVVTGNYLDPGTGLVTGFVYANGAYTSVAVPSALSTSLGAINGAGLALGTYEAVGNTIHSFTYDGSNITFLPDYPGTGVTETAAYGINNAGRIVGVTSSDASFVPFSGFELVAGVYTPYAYPGSVSTGLLGINDSGAIVGNYFDAQGGSFGFLLPSGLASTPVEVNFPGAAGTWPLSINNFGDIAGFYEDSDNIGHGFVYDGSTYLTVDYPDDPGLSPVIPGETGTFLWQINDQGQLAGTYNNYSNGFVASVVPEPSTYALVLLGAGAVYAWGRRRSLPRG